MIQSRRVRVWTILALILIAISIPHPSHAKKKTFASAKKITFLVAGMTCERCANSASKELLKIPGVSIADVDIVTKQARLSADSSVTQEAIRGALGSIGFEAQFPNDLPKAKPLTEIEKAPLDIRVVSHGEAFKIKDHLSTGKFTIFDFYAEWCGPCHLLTPKLERLVLQNNNIALRTIDIGNWNSDAAKQATKEYEMPGLPYVRVYGADGDFIGAVTGNHFEAIESLIASSNSSINER